MTPDTQAGVPSGAAPQAAAVAVVVLDTNIWLDLLVFDDAGTAWLGAALHAGRLRAAIDAFGLDELTRVLGYPLGRFAIARERRPAILDACRTLAFEFTPAPADGMAPLPRCRDRHDQPFLELAQACDARCLITKDRDLLMLARRLRGVAAFVIAAPAAARSLLAPDVETVSAAAHA